jgi:hypothetical protein
VAAVVRPEGLCRRLRAVGGGRTGASPSQRWTTRDKGCHHNHHHHTPSITLAATATTTLATTTTKTTPAALKRADSKAMFEVKRQRDVRGKSSQSKSLSSALQPRPGAGAGGAFPSSYRNTLLKQQHKRDETPTRDRTNLVPVAVAGALRGRRRKRRDRRLVRSLSSRSSSREGGKDVELNLRCPRAAADEGGDADTNADDLSGLSFKASLLRSMPPPLFGSLDDRLCGDLAGDRREPLGVCPITTCVTIFPNCPARSRHRGLRRRPPQRRSRQSTRCSLVKISRMNELVKPLISLV